MLDFLANILGTIMRLIYEGLSNSITEPSNISFYALSIILMTLLTKAITIPLTVKSQKNAKQMTELKPEVDKLQKKYGYDQMILQKKTQELYKEKGINQMGLSSCLTMIFPLIILLALFRVMNDSSKYVFLNQIDMESINTNFFWVPSLMKADPLWFGLPLATSLSQFAFSLFNMKTNPAMGSNPQMSSMNTMFLVLPLVYFFFFRKLAAGLPLYYTVSSLIELIFRAITYFFFENKEVTVKEGN